MSRRLANVLPPLLAGVAILVVWAVVSTRSFVVPSPVETVEALIDQLGRDAYREHIRSTASKTAWAAAIGIALGLVVGLLIGHSRLLRDMFEPMLVSLNALPKIVLYPIIVSLMTLGPRSQVTLGVLFSFFPVLINVSAGVQAIPSVYLRLGRSLQIGRVGAVTQIVLPAIRRPLLTGSRLAISLATVGVVLAEIFATKLGLGREIMRTYGDGRYPEMMATIVVLMLASFIVSLVMWRFERRVK